MSNKWFAIIISILLVMVIAEGVYIFTSVDDGTVIAENMVDATEVEEPVVIAEAEPIEDPVIVEVEPIEGSGSDRRGRVGYYHRRKCRT